MRRSRTALASEHGVVKTNRRQPPPTHLADVLGGFLIDSREGSDLKQPECSTKKLMLSKAKLAKISRADPPPNRCQRRMNSIMARS